MNKNVITSAPEYIIGHKSGHDVLMPYAALSQSFPAGIVLPNAAGIGIKVNEASPAFGWRDMIGILRPDPVSPPTLAAFRGGMVRDYFYTAGDQMDMNFHIPHDYVPGTDVYVHLHWSHNGTAISGSLVATCTYTYAKGHNQAVFSPEKAVTVTYATVNIATTPAWIHRIDEVAMTTSTPGGTATLMDNALLEPDGIVMMNMRATTIPLITGAPSLNEPVIFFADLHYQSTSIGTKGKAPSFYA